MGRSVIPSALSPGTESDETRMETMGNGSNGNGEVETPRLRDALEKVRPELALLANKT
jgi:hypothetical protein